jgi:hypothetical protein
MVKACMTSVTTDNAAGGDLALSSAIVFLVVYLAIAQIRFLISLSPGGPYTSIL